MKGVLISGWIASQVLEEKKPSRVQFVVLPLQHGRPLSASRRWLVVNSTLIAAENDLGGQD